MSFSKKLYSDGFLNLSFNHEESLNLIHKTIKEMNSSEIKNNFFWEEKYQNTHDFRPSVFEYDDVFIDILVKNNIHNIINEATQKQLLLTHIQLRRVFPGPSYMNWHRDTHFKSGNVVSTCPPAYKIIFFPSLEESNDECLKILKGSHVCMNPSQTESEFISPGFSSFDHQILNSGLLPVVSACESKSDFLFFDISCLHAAQASKKEEGSIRLVYLFMPEEQFNERYASKQIHFNLNKIYQERAFKR
jgi:ectoine hydroxylase-related dioxygenase (phytanoyl-CoA dioxygenase family)